MYKRQHLSSVWTGAGLLPNAGAAAEDVAAAVKGVHRFEHGGRGDVLDHGKGAGLAYEVAGPVSYTHLDVYKRQRVYLQHWIPDYPSNLSFIVSDEGFGKNDYIETSRRLVVVLSLIHISAHPAPHRPRRLGRAPARPGA